MFQGENVYLRPIEMEDLPLLYKWLNDPELVECTWPGVPHPVPMEKVEQQFEEGLSDSSERAFLICDSSSKRPIGTIKVTNIAPRSQRGNLTIVLGEKEFWGQGYGAEAIVLFLNYCFRILNLRRISLEVHEYNERAIKCYEKVGFQKEGRVRRSVFKNGQYVDEYVMAILKDEFYEMFPLKR